MDFDVTTYQRCCRLLLSWALAAAWMSVPGVASGASDAKALELRGIMRELGTQMEAMAGALAREDFGAIERAARATREHREPPMPEKARIIAYFGGRMGRFKSLDDEVKRAAADIESAAGRHDGQGVIDAFQRLQSSCLGCHVEFRRDFQTHFYGMSQAMPKE